MNLAFREWRQEDDELLAQLAWANKVETLSQHLPCPHPNQIRVERIQFAFLANPASMFIHMDILFIARVISLVTSGTS